MTKISKGLASLLVALPFAALAQDQQTNMFWPGQDASCSTWTKYRSNREVRQYYLYWIIGFVSGHNVGTPSRQIKAGAFPDAEGVYRYLDQYCQDNPKSSFMGGAIALDRELRDQPPAKAPPAKGAAKPGAAK
jgi:hypothetical protein